MTLRIQRSVEPESVVFTVSCRIQADHVAEQQALETSESSDCDVVLDPRLVKLIGRDVVRVWARGRAEGVERRNCSA
jgi:hypothetical protein